MSEEVPMANPPLSIEEEAAVAKLSDADLQIIDSVILANSSSRFLKVARVVISTEKALSDHYPDLSYIFYAQRLIQLAREGRLQSQGKLEYMRFSEVRITA
jgi:hypothetical protein